MKIYYSPEYDGHLYVNSSDGSSSQMDVITVNTMGLIQLMALRLGLHEETLPQHKCLALYYEAMCKFMKDNPKNILARSFELSGLATAKTVLGWHNELRAAGVGFHQSLTNQKDVTLSERLQAIFDIEAYLGEDFGKDWVDQLKNVSDELKAQSCDYCKDYEIVLPVPHYLLRPLERDFVVLLESRGATISQQPFADNADDNLSLVRQLIVEGQNVKIKLDKHDDSFSIYEFPDENVAHQYLSYKGFEDIDVWVNADNKQMDNWLSLMKKPLTGSKMLDCSPQLAELFVIGVSLFMNPLNVSSLIEWLNMPLHPIPAYFRGRLADAIVREGGYRNEACQLLLQEYVEGKYVFLSEEEKEKDAEEIEKIRMKDAKKRKALVQYFLPPMDAESDIRVAQLKEFSQALSTWIVQKLALMQDERLQMLYVEQLNAVKDMADTFLILLDTVNSDTIDNKVIDSWLSSIYTKSSFVNTMAEQGGRMVVDSPAKLVTISCNTVWMGLDGDTSAPKECSFLYPSEKEQLVSNNLITPWEELKESKYHEWMGMMPILHTSRHLILVVCKHRDGELTQKHPLLVRLEQQVENLEDVIERPVFSAGEIEKVEEFANVNPDDTVSFGYADKLQWPDHLSPTTISTLVEHPFDYLMENLLKITADGKAQMSDAKTTMGNVAHAVIEHLFAPRDGKRVSLADEIRLRISHEYDEVFSKTMDAHGAILLLAENRLAGKLLREQLRNCLNVLVGILGDNQLVVTGCEHLVRYEEILGVVDMTLEDKEGHPVVFDFKWTSSKKYYQGLLEKNRSVQLELYRYLFSHEMKDQVKKVAYFLMPEAQLYSHEYFKGEHCTQLEAVNQDDIVAQLKRSVAYRKKQLSEGLVEVKGFFEEIPYVDATEQKGLFPLEQSGDGKKENIFSNYGLFE